MYLYLYCDSNRSTKSFRQHLAHNVPYRTIIYQDFRTCSMILLWQKWNTIFAPQYNKVIITANSNELLCTFLSELRRALCKENQQSTAHQDLMASKYYKLENSRNPLGVVPSLRTEKEWQRTEIDGRRIALCEFDVLIISDSRGAKSL